VTLSLLSVNPSQPSDDLAAAEKQGPRLHRVVEVCRSGMSEIKHFQREV